LDQIENLFLFLKKAATSEHCVINIIIIFWFIIISEIDPNGQFSKIVNLNRTDAGLTSKWGRISPAVNGAIRTSSSAPHENVRRRMRLQLNILFGDSQDIVSFHCFIVT